jgi:hypothetical protein
MIAPPSKIVTICYFILHIATLCNYRLLSRL